MTLSQATDFSTLPLDVIFRILGFCQVPEIVRVRQCSKHFNKTTRHHGVWFSVLNDFCITMGVSARSFAPGFETMTAAQLEAYSTRHLRFRNKARLHSEKKLSTSFILRHRRIEQPGGGISSVLVLRGGRFIVTASTTQLCLWDMEFGMDSQPKLICSTSLSIPGTYTSMETNQFCDTYHIVIFSRPFRDPGPLLLKYELEFSSTSPLNFRYIGKFTAPRGLTCWALARKKIAFFCCIYDDHILGAHDFESGSTMMVSPEKHYGCVTILGKDEMHIAASDRRTVEMYSLTPSLVTSPPMTFIPPAAELGYSYCDVLSFNTSSNLDADIAVVDALGHTQEGSDELVGISLHLNPNGATVFQNIVTGRPLDRYINLGRASNAPVFTTFNEPDRSLKTVWCRMYSQRGNETGCFLYFSSMKDKKKDVEGTKDFKVCMVANHTLNQGAAWIDPFSGRTAYVEDGGLVAIDYLE